MRHARHLGIGIRSPMKGGNIGKSNLAKLEQDFAKSISFGKAEPKMGAEAIKKKFSI